MSAKPLMRDIQPLRSSHTLPVRRAEEAARAPRWRRSVASIRSQRCNVPRGTPAADGSSPAPHAASPRSVTPSGAVEWPGKSRDRRSKGRPSPRRCAAAVSERDGLVTAHPERSRRGACVLSLPTHPRPHHATTLVHRLTPLSTAPVDDGSLFRRPARAPRDTRWHPSASITSASPRAHHTPARCAAVGRVDQRCVDHRPGTTPARAPGDARLMSCPCSLVVLRARADPTARCTRRTRPPADDRSGPCRQGQNGPTR